MIKLPRDIVIAGALYRPPRVKQKERHTPFFAHCVSTWANLSGAEWAILSRTQKFRFLNT